MEHEHDHAGEQDPVFLEGDAVEAAPMEDEVLSITMDSSVTGE